LPLGPLQVPPVQLLSDLHSPLPEQVASQLFVPVQKLPPHSLAGSVADASGVHRPTVPPRLQAMQVPLHAESQHTPSAQDPDGHCAPSTHPVPGALRGRHWPPLQ
jgi:hypothetical protein